MHAQVRELSVVQFEEVMSGVSAPLMVLLRRAALIRSALMKALSTPQGKSAAAAAAAAAATRGGGGEDEVALAKELMQTVETASLELLQHVCEVAQDRYARLLKVRVRAVVAIVSSLTPFPTPYPPTPNPYPAPYPAPLPRPATPPPYPPPFLLVAPSLPLATPSTHLPLSHRRMLVFATLPPLSLPPLPPALHAQTRKEVHSRLTLVDFCRMNASVTEFVRDVQHLQPHSAGQGQGQQRGGGGGGGGGGSSSSSLATELRDHASEFLRCMHEGAARKLEALVEMEQWKQVDVAPEFQEIAEALGRNQVPRASESELMRLRNDAAKLDAAAAAAAGGADGSGGGAREVVVDGVGYKCVGSSLLLLAMTAHHLQCVSSLQTVGPQLAQLLPSLLKLFHTLCYKQVLMAGAMRQVSAGLKAITFKHLALASQSLCLVLATRTSRP